MKLIDTLINKIAEKTAEKLAEHIIKEGKIKSTPYYTPPSDWHPCPQEPVVVMYGCNPVPYQPYVSSDVTLTVSETSIKK